MQKEIPHFGTVTLENDHSRFGSRQYGSVSATDPMAALKNIVDTYENPAELYSAVITVPDATFKVLARYLSARAATEREAPNGPREWGQEGLYVHGEKVPAREERYERVA